MLSKQKDEQIERVLDTKDQIVTTEHEKLVSKIEEMKWKHEQ